MNYIDVVFCVILFVAAVQGFRKGFVVEFASLAALVLGIWGAIKFTDWTAGYISKTFNYHPSYLNTVAFLLTFVVIVILVHLLGKILDSTVKAVALGFLNRLAGIIFGVLKTAVILSILLMLFDPIDENVHILPTKQKAESKIYTPTKQLVTTLFPFINFWNIHKENKSDDKPTEPATTTKSS